MKRDKEGLYIMIKGSIQEEVINICAPNIGVPQYRRQMLTRMKGQINSNTVILGDFNTPLTPMAEKEMATHFSILAWRIPGRGESGGLLSLGSHRVRHD